MEVTHGILRATYQISKEMGLENWIFVLEPSLVRFVITSYSIHYTKLYENSIGRKTIG